MSIFEKSYNCKEFKKILDFYNTCTKQKMYERSFSYEEWRRLTGVPFVNLKLDDGENNLELSFLCKDSNDKLMSRAIVVEKGAPGSPTFYDFFSTNYLSKIKETADLDNIIMNSSEMAKHLTGVANSINNISYSNGTYSNNLTLNHWTDGIERINGLSTNTNFDKSSWLSTSTTMSSEIEDIQKRLTNLEENKEKENNNMKGFNFDFGPCTNDKVRMSMYGLAIENTDGTWVSYNKETDQIIDVDILNFDGRKFMFKMPVAVSDIAEGDVIIHNRVPMFVNEVDGDIVAVDIRAGERKIIIPTTNAFGFNFVTKVVSLFSSFGPSPSAETPFGNMLPLLMMGDGKDMDMSAAMMLMMMQSKDSMDFTKNPMMLYFMMKDGNKESDLLPLMLMMNMNHLQKPTE